MLDRKRHWLQTQIARVNTHDSISAFRKSHFQNKFKRKTSLVKMRFICMNNYINGLELSLALKQRLEATRIWPVMR